MFYFLLVLIAALWNTIILMWLFSNHFKLLMRMDRIYAIWIKIGINIGLQATIKMTKTSSHRRRSVKKGVPRISQNSQENTYAKVSFWIKLQGPATLLKRRLWHKCFPVSFTKSLRTPFLQNTSGWLLLQRVTNIYKLYFFVPLLCLVVKGGWMVD